MNIALYHYSPAEITAIHANGRFGEFLFFSPEDKQATHTIFVDEDSVIDASQLFYHEDAALLDEIRGEVMERFDVDEDTAEDLISEKTDLLDLDKFDADDSWDMQLYTAKAAKLLGYKGVRVRDEYGTSYMIDMEGRESELKRI